MGGQGCRRRWGEKKREKEKKPQFMPLCRTSKCFSIISDSFRHLSPAAGSGSCFSARWTTANSETEITNEAKGKSSGWSRPAGRSRANNTTCKTKGSSLPHLNNLSNRHHNCSPSIGQEKSEGKEGRMGAVLFHIKVNEFTTSNCGAKLIEKVYSASRKAIPFSTC